MNSSKVLAAGLKCAKKMAPLPPGKNPVTAFVAGVMFGPFGTGIYLGTARDFFYPLAILMAATTFTAGLAAPLAWLFCGVYGAMRVNESNTQT